MFAKPATTAKPMPPAKKPTPAKPMPATHNGDAKAASTSTNPACQQRPTAKPQATVDLKSTAAIIAPGTHAIGDIRAESQGGMVDLSGSVSKTGSVVAFASSGPTDEKTQAALMRLLAAI
jgi:hypothetical protein